MDFGDMPALQISITVMTKLAEDWTKLTDKKKAVYKKQAQVDQTRYELDIKHLLTHGYFIRQDGTESQNNQKPKKAKSDVKDETEKPKVGTKRSKEQPEATASAKR